MVGVPGGLISDIRAAVAADPLGIVAALLLAVAAGVGAMLAVQQIQEFQRVPIVEHEETAPAPKGPATWIKAARRGDIMSVPGHTVAYWADPKGPYGARVTRQRRRVAGIVIHFPVSTRLMPSVFYGHRRDRQRGGGVFGYHFYLGGQGQIVQGAPLTRRTNHVLGAGSSKRRPNAAVGHDSRDLIGIATVGACVRGSGPMCTHESLTDAQRAATLALVAALQERYKLPCDAIWGHGEMQTNRLPFEGRTIATEVRARCRELPMALGAR